MKSKNVLKFTCEDILKCRYEIFGIAAIWIVMFHIRNHVGFPSSLAVLR